MDVEGPFALVAPVECSGDVSRRGKYFFLILSITVAENVPERSQRSTTRFTFSYCCRREARGGFIVIGGRVVMTKRVKPDPVPQSDHVEW
jgi:hypothetical protein